MQFILNNLIKITVFSILIFNYSIAQSQSNKNDDYSKIEDLIIKKKIDSAKLLVKEIKPINNFNTLELLKKFCSNSQTYSDYYKLATRINNRPTDNIDPFIKYVTSIPTPTSKEKIKLDYVYTYWLLITKLRNFSKIDKAGSLNNKLQEYVLLFNQNNNDVKKANLLLNNHQIVLHLIEGKIKEGKALCEINLEEANKLNDNTLKIIYLNHLCDFLAEERDLDGFIKNGELSLSLESDSSKKSPYYIQTLEKLIDAYLFKGGFENRVFELLNTIYSNKSAKKHSYSLYANFLRVIDKNSDYTQKILKQFNVDSYISFCTFIEADAKNSLDQNQLYFILDQCSKLLESKGYLKDAIAYKTKCVQITRKIYSEDLANSLANHRTEIAVKTKEVELSHEKEKYQLLAIITILTLLILITLIFVIIKKNKQEKLLKSKNKEILEQRDAIKKKEKEKGLLLREVHHRVKNNFQIVSSLLELQSKGIEDDIARKLANDGKNRIKSMALIHQKLYQNDSNLIDFDEYIKLLVKELTGIYASDKKINTSILSDKALFDVDTAIPLGLIINELITNSYKYAFNNKEENNLNISLSKENNNYYKLTVSDNGPGLKDNVDIKKLKSLGLRLVTRLVRQLQGTIDFKNSNGANFEILFRDTNARKLTN